MIIEKRLHNLIIKAEDEMDREILKEIGCNGLRVQNITRDGGKIGAGTCMLTWEKNNEE